MSHALLAMSHSPLLEYVDPSPEVKAAVEDAFTEARRFVHEFDPDLIVTFGPDWSAAYSALGAIGSYQVDYSFYRPIKEYIAGFAVTTAVPRP